MYIGCAVLLCLVVCMTLLASFSSLIKTCIIVLVPIRAFSLNMTTCYIQSAGFHTGSLAWGGGSF